MALKLYPVDKGGRLNLGADYAGTTWQVAKLAPGEQADGFTNESKDEVLVLSPVEIVSSRQRTPATPDQDAPPFAA